MALRRIERRKERQKRIVMAVIVAFLMVMSGFGVYLSGQGARQESVKEYGEVFTVDRQSRTYTSDLTGQPQPYYFLPSSVEQHALSSSDLSLLRDARALVFTFDPTASRQQLGAISELRLDLSSMLGKPTINAVTKNTTSYSLPVVTCANATSQVPVVSFEVADEPSLALDDACLHVQGNGTSFYEMRDALVYSYHDVYGSS